jgi:hypothetical protein
MARLSKIAGYVIAAVVVLTIVLSEIAERKEAADINAALDDLLASLTKICARLELEKLNHITRVHGSWLPPFRNPGRYLSPTVKRPEIANQTGQLLALKKPDPSTST